MITMTCRAFLNFAALAAALFISSLACAATTLPGMPDAGWAVWQVDAVPGAPGWCCGEDDRGRETACRLDDKTGFYSTGPDHRTTQAVRLYVHMAGGRPQTIRALAADCPVTSTGEIVDLGAVDAAASAAWLQQHIDAGPPAEVARAIAALAMHAGTAARDTLIAVAGRGRPAEQRRDAVFWMAQVRTHDSADALTRLMFEDADPELRAHAAFSLSQSDIPGRFASLERLAITDASEQVRARAWFWLARIEAPGIEAAIRARLAEEPDAEAREQMVFTLSQLPAGRALAALSDLIADPALDRGVRKRALFWLAQNESPEALERLAELLTVSER